MPFRSLAADDIFISYTRLDASTYAAGLADELTKKGFSCFIDKLGTDPNRDLPDMLLRKLKSCAMLVVVGTERAATRQTIADEVKEFLATGRKSSVVPIDFSGAIYRASWYPLVEGVAPEPEKNPTALDDGDPSPSVLSRIEKQFNYTRRNQRLRRAATSMAVVFALLLLAGIGAGVYARQQIVLAREARTEADNARSAAISERQAAQRAKEEAASERDKAIEQKIKADKADADARLAEDRAGKAAKREQVARALEAKATANARLQETIASSRAKATAALRFGATEPDHALTESIEAYRLHPTAEARSSLLASLELYPNLVGVARENPNPIDSLASARNGAVLVSSDDTGLILFWDATRKRVFKRVEPPAKKIYSVRVACAPGGSVCAADYIGGNLSVFEIQTRGEEYEVNERASFNSFTDINIPVPITPVFAKPDLLVTVGDASTFRRTQDIALIDLGQATPQPVIKKLAVPQDVTRDDFGVARVMTANVATKTIAIGFNRGIALWDIDALDKPANWIRHPNGWTGIDHITESLSFSPDGKYLAVSVNGGHVAVWNLSEDEPKLVNDPHPNAGTFVALFNHSLSDREATYMVTAKRTGEISLWDIWNPATELRSFKPGISALIPTGDSGSVATGSSDGLLASWEMGRTASLRQSLTAPVKYPRAFAFGRTTGLLYAASGVQSEDDTGSALWREERGRYEPLSPGEKRSEFAAGEFGLQLLPDTSSESIGLRDVYGARPEEMRVAIKHTPSAPRAISPDGHTLAIGDSATRPWNISEVEPTSIVVWDISDKAHPRKLNSLAFDGRPVTIAFGDDGATLAASYDNGRIILWDYLKGTSRKQFLVSEVARDYWRGRKYSAGRVALSPDGRLLAAKSDGPISLWDVETGLLLGRLGPESYPFRVGEDYPSGWMVFSRDGKSLIVAGGYSDGVIDVWNLDPETWAAMASSIIGRR
jgi:WD40 repeat protein